MTTLEKLEIREEAFREAAKIIQRRGAEARTHIANELNRIIQTRKAIRNADKALAEDFKARVL